MDEVMEPVKAKTIHWQKKMIIPNTSWEICGYSRSAYRTGFYIRSLDMMLDAGPQNFNKPKHILITHMHIDHVACLPLTMIGDETQNHIFEIYGVDSGQEKLHNYIASMFRLNANNDDIDPSPWYNYHKVTKGEILKFVCKNTNIEVQVFECDHAIPTVSYGVSEIKQKLKDEYLGINGKEIGKLRMSGVTVTKEVTVRRFAYVCDTSIAVFNMNPDILNYDTIFIECTFIYDEELDNAIKTKHIHWSQLKPYIEKNKDKTFILFHFSQRYTNSEIKEFFDKEKSNGLTNIEWW